MSLVRLVVIITLLAVFGLGSPNPHQHPLFSHPLQPDNNIPDLLDASITDLRAALNDGQITSLELVRAYQARIAEVNAYTHAVIEINPAAEEEAMRADAARSQRNFTQAGSLLHGIPILVKDNIAAGIDDGLNTTAGSFALLGTVPLHDAFVITKLKKAGAIILGKANMCEWANGRGHITFGWSARGGQTLSPFLYGGNPCGSAGGSAVATSLGLAAASVGTQTGWSIICPAGHNNVVGLGTTKGLTSRDSIVPLILDRDTVGPIGKTVTDTAILLQAMAGEDPNDKETLQQPPVPDYLAALSTHALDGSRIGVLKLSDIPIPRAMMLPGQTQTPKEVYDRLLWATNIIENLGATILDPVDMSEQDLKAWSYFLSPANKINRSISGSYSFKTGLDAYLASLKVNPRDLRTAQDIVAFNFEHKDLELPDDKDDQQFLIETAEVTERNRTAYLAAQVVIHDLVTYHSLDHVMDHHNLDALVTVLGNAEPIPFTAFAGLPVLSVPLGFFSDNVEAQPFGSGTVYPAPNMPYGLLFIGRKWNEQKLLGYAYAFEQATQVRKETKDRIIPEAMPTSGL